MSDIKEVGDEMRDADDKFPYILVRLSRRKLVPNFSYGASFFGSSVICSFFIRSPWLAEWDSFPVRLICFQGRPSHQPTNQGKDKEMQGQDREQENMVVGMLLRHNGCKISFIFHLPSRILLERFPRRGKWKIFQWLANLFKIQNKSLKVSPSGLIAVVVRVRVDQVGSGTLGMSILHYRWRWLLLLRFYSSGRPHSNVTRHLLGLSRPPRHSRHLAADKLDQSVEDDQKEADKWADACRIDDLIYLRDETERRWLKSTGDRRLKDLLYSLG